MWPHPDQSQSWQAPRWTQGMTSAHPLTPRGMSSNHWQSPLRPPPTGDATSAGVVGVDVGRQDNSGTEWNPSGKGSQQGRSTTMEITDRDPVQKWDFQEPGARLKPWLRELSFWRHDTSTLLHKHGVKLYKSLPLGNVGRSVADQFSEEQICSSQGFELIIGAIRNHFRSYLEAEPEVLGGSGFVSNNSSTERQLLRS